MTVIGDSPAGQQAVEERYRAFLGHWPVPQAIVTLLPGSGHLLLGQAQRIGEFLTRGADSDT
jgi:hypothetical protein